MYGDWCSAGTVAAARDALRRSRMRDKSLISDLFQGQLVALDTVNNLLSLQSSSDLEEVFLTITEEQRNQSAAQ